MKYYPVSLGVIRQSWNPTKIATKIKDPEQERQRVFQRDDHTCKCCGFRSEKYQQILFLNGETTDFSDDNVLTTCIYCHQCFDLESVARMHSGMLIWLPEMTQVELNHMMRSVYLARVVQGPLADTARKIFDVVYARGEDAKKRLGSTDPGALAMVLRDFMTTAEYKKAQENLEGIRLLPLDRRMMPNEKEGGMDNQFPMIFGYWRMKAGPFGHIPTPEWPQLFKNLA